MTFIAEAGRGKNTHWIWYILGVCVVFLGYVLGQLPLTLVIQRKLAINAISSEAAADFYRTVEFAALGMSSHVGLLLLLCTFIMALIALFGYMVYVHGRRFRSLISSGPVNWKKIFFGFIVWFVLTALAEVVLYMINPGAYTLALNWNAWLPLMLIVLCILPLQTSFEELFVRGYLLQSIGLISNRPWVAIVATSVFFGIMHVSNPEVAEYGFGIMMVYYVSVGVFLAVITLLDDGLELALGIHAATNVYAAGFVTYTGSALQTDAVVQVNIINPEWMVLLFFAMMIVFYVLASRKYGLRNYTLLFRSVREEPVHNLP